MAITEGSRAGMLRSILAQCDEEKRRADALAAENVRLRGLLEEVANMGVSHWFATCSSRPSADCDCGAKELETRIEAALDTEAGTGL